MKRSLVTPLAREQLSVILKAGFTVDLTDLEPRTPKPWSETADMPGIQLTAVRIGSDRSTSVQVRDWSRARAELEAIVLLAHHLHISLDADADDYGILAA